MSEGLVGEKTAKQAAEHIEALEQAVANIKEAIAELNKIASGADR